MNCNVIPARYVMAVMGLFGTFTNYMLKVNLSVAIVDMVDFDALESNLTKQNEEIWNMTTQKPQQASSGFSCLGDDSSRQDTHVGRISRILRHFQSERTSPHFPLLAQLIHGFKLYFRQNGIRGNGKDLQLIFAQLQRSQSNDQNKTSSINERKFLWTAGQQGLVLGAFSYGGTVTQIGMAHLNQRFGHVRVTGITVLGASILTLLNPVVAESIGYAGYVILRILIGILTGATPPQIMGLAGIWSPPHERSRIISIIFAGIPLGVCCTMIAAGRIAATLGWKYVFYVTGACGMCWAILWLFLVHETPDDHPRISHSEKQFINLSLQKPSVEEKVKRKIPWLKILKSGPVICVIIVHFCSIYGRHTISSMFPTYLKTVQNVDVEMSGILSAIPFAVNGVLVFATGTIADMFITRGYRAIIVRKVFTGIGLTVSAATIVGLGYTGCDVPVAVTLATVVVAMDAFAVPGFKTCMVDIAPELSGVVFSISATVAVSTGILAPQITGSLRQAYGFLGWKIAFWIAAGLYVIGAGEFIIFGTNEKQSWATPNNPRSSVATITEVID